MAVIRLGLSLAVLMTLTAHAEVQIRDVRWAQSGSLSLAVALGGGNRPIFETVTFVDPKQDLPQTVGAVTVSVRFPGADAKTLLVVVRSDGLLSAAGAPLAALFVARLGPDQQFAVVNNTPILNSAATFDENLRSLTAGLKRKGCSESGTLMALVKYKEVYPERVLAEAVNDMVNERFGAGTADLCVTPPIKSAVVDVQTPIELTPPKPPPSPAPVKAKPTPRPKQRYVDRGDGVIWDTEKNEEYVSDAQRRYRERQSQSRETYDRGGAGTPRYDSGRYGGGGYGEYRGSGSGYGY